MRKILVCLFLVLAVPLHAGDGDEPKPKKKIPPPPCDNLVVSNELLGKDAAKFEKADQEYRKFLATRSEKSLKSARSGFQSIPKSCLGYPVAGFKLSELFYLDEEYDKARDLLKSLVTLNPQFYEAHTLLGHVEQRDKRPQDALPAYDKALAIYPYYADALEGLAQAHVYLGRFPEAVQNFKKHMEIEDSEDSERYVQFLERHIKGPNWTRSYVSESENYIVKTGISQAYADDISRRMEKVRKLYMQYFPVIDRLPRKYEVLAYTNRDDYLAHGAPAAAAGHYSPFTRVLNIYEHDDHGDTLLTLYHEGFHQYLHEYADSIPQWFNEGLGDYFGGALIWPDGKQAEMAANTWRVDFVKQAIQLRACPTTDTLMRMTREQMYGANASIHYAQAWAIVYYCLEGGNSAHKNTLVAYFKAVRKGTDPIEAFDQTFGKIDIKRFDANWQNFIDRQPTKKEIEARRAKIAKGG